jgi:hypothetical protein
MATSITIRDVPEATSAELSARAALTRGSLQEYLRGQLVVLAETPDTVWVARLRARTLATGGGIDVATILEHRDADRTSAAARLRDHRADARGIGHGKRAEARGDHGSSRRAAGRPYRVLSRSFGVVAATSTDRDTTARGASELPIRRGTATEVT